MSHYDLLTRAAIRELEILAKGIKSNQEVSTRLWEASNRPRIVAVDCDGTILNYDPTFHQGEYGTQIKGMVKELQILRDNGWKIVIWTCRSDSPDLRQHLDKIGVPYDFINNHPWNGPDEPRKIMADCYIDDRGISFNGNTTGLAKRVMEYKPWWMTD